MLARCTALDVRGYLSKKILVLTNIHMKFSKLSLISLFTVGTGIVACNMEPTSRQELPNIIILITDDQGWGDLSIHGNTNLSTPNIDRLAHQGVQFNHFYVQPVCSPTRADLLTGRYHPRSGVSGTQNGAERVNGDETMIADIFKEAGYATAAYGKWHNGMQFPYHPNARGFDEFYGFCAGHWADYFSPPLEHNGKIVRGDGYLPDDFTTRAIDFIRENHDSPFLVYLAFNTPHRPMQVPDKWYDKFKDKQMEMTVDDRYTEDIDFTKAALAMCENIDWNVGRVVKVLEELGIEEKTVVLFMNDNGPNSARWNGGMKGRKVHVDEGGVRSPLFIQWKGSIQQGTVIEEIAGAIDLLPTLADLAGIEYETRYPLDGLSLKPLIMKEEELWGDRFIFSHFNDRVSVRSQRYRLDHEGKLYDMVLDPGQFNDISEKDPEVHKELSGAVEEWRKTVLSGLRIEDRPFTVGHPEALYTQLPAADGRPHENVVRSNRWVSDSYFTNWTSLDDKITWDVEVLASGNFDVEIYYTCPPADTGTAFTLSFGNSVLEGTITKPHDPPLTGMQYERLARNESYTKDFIPMKMGSIYLEHGRGEMKLQAKEIPGSQVMDFKTLVLKRNK
jgi:arylsulfatase A-like enzyme